ncbi:MAG: MerR family transcriptional regulator [Bacteroidetes bacterium]|nr:MerR family transcriptional regulator [Bacteroidota bacterium]
MENSGYTTRTAARLTGLTPYVLRAWEKRYGVVRPLRTESNRRMYSDADIERLRLLRKATVAGFAISDMAALNDEELRVLLQRIEDEEDNAAHAGKNYASWRSALMRETVRMHAAGLERALLEADRQLSRAALIDNVLSPFLNDIGNGWREGEVRIAQEHFSTAVIRSVLLRLLTASVPFPDAPHVLTATPSGQQHELGVLLAGLVAADAGLAVTHLGADLPGEEIAAAARELQSRTVLLSIVYPPDDERTFAELAELLRLLPPDTKVIVGGVSAAPYLARLQHETLQYIESTAGLREYFSRE